MNEEWLSDEIETDVGWVTGWTWRGIERICIESQQYNNSVVTVTTWPDQDCDWRTESNHGKNLVRCQVGLFVCGRKSVWVSEWVSECLCGTFEGTTKVSLSPPNTNHQNYGHHHHLVSESLTFVSPSPSSSPTPNIHLPLQPRICTCNTTHTYVTSFLTTIVINQPHTCMTLQQHTLDISTHSLTHTPVSAKVKLTDLRHQTRCRKRLCQCVLVPVGWRCVCAEVEYPSGLSVLEPKCIPKVIASCGENGIDYGLTGKVFCDLIYWVQVTSTIFTPQSVNYPQLSFCSKSPAPDKCR